MFRKRLAKKLVTTLNTIESFGDHGELSLNVQQFMVIGGLVQMHTGFYIQYFNNFMAQKTGVVFLLTVLQVLFIRIPFHFFLLFLGYYTKRKVIRLWHCIPLFKGMGYVLLLVCNITFIYNQYICSTYLLMYIYFPQKSENTDIWLNCKFPEATNSCIPMANNASVNCVPEEYHELSMFQYIRTHILKQKFPMDILPLDSLNSRFVLTSWCLWFITSAVIFFGLTRIIDVFLVVLAAVATSLSLITISIVAFAPPMKVSSLNYVIKANAGNSFLRPSGYEIIFWTKAVIHCTRPLELASSIWLGANKPPEAKTTLCAIGIFIFSGLYTLLHAISVKYTLDHFVFHYWNILKKCSIPISGNDITITTMEYFLRTDEPHLWMSFFLFTRILYSSMQNFVSGFAIFDSIIDAFPRLRQNRFLSCLAFCTINHLLSLILLSSISETVLHIWLRFESITLGIIVLAIVSICFNYIYTLDMISSDYAFLYLGEPSGLFKSLWTTFPVVSLFMVSVGFQTIVTTHTALMEPNTRIIVYIFTFIIFSPFFLFFIIELVKGINYEDEHPDRPVRDWGPQDPVERYKRNKFIPYRDLCYRHTSMTCVHDCLAKVESYSEEVTIQNKKYEDALELLALRETISIQESKTTFADNLTITETSSKTTSAANLNTA